MRDVYQVLSVAYRQLKAYDSAFYYNDRYIKLHDSLEKAVVTSSLAISKARLNDELSRFNIQKLNRERQAELTWRNGLILAIVLLAAIALLVVNRQLLKEKLKANKAEQEKKLLAQDVQAATEQLHMFTTNILEKTHLIEQLEQEMTERQANTDHHATLSSLGQLTILTEDDWQQFKRLFEKAYPGFFHTLTGRFPDITLAEQRMAALIKLQLSGHQMASMLGISADSVRKSRQRLRQRLQVGPEANLDELIASL
jgi:hypothetical protein